MGSEPMSDTDRLGDEDGRRSPIFEREQIVTDGGAERALLWECDSVHPVDAAHKPWGVTDE